MRLLALFATLLALSGCDANGSFYAPARYEAVAFTEPSQMDGGVDVLANGGSLSIDLAGDKTYTGSRTVPEGILAHSPGTDIALSGTWDFTETGRLAFTADEGTPPALYWTDEARVIRAGERLETEDQPGHGATFKIVLERR
ncbi:MAG: hypothetical protein AAGI52_12955 [Bacteroidota bacterium]